MSNTRSDVHRPAEFVPQDYRFVCIHLGGRELEESFVGNAEAIAALNADMSRTGAKYSSHDHGGSCHICGAWANSLATFHHAKSNTYIQTGLDCAEKVEIGDPEVFRSHRHAVGQFRSSQAAALRLKKGKLKAQALLAKAGLSKCWNISQSFKTKHACENHYQFGGRTGGSALIADVVRSVVKYGHLSAKQEALLKRLVARRHTIAKRIKEARNAPTVAPVAAPEGRVPIKGEVLSKKFVENQFGGTDKILVKTDVGFKVWCSLPASIYWTKKGDVVSFKVTLERSKDDEGFAFGKRPSVATNWTCPKEADGQLRD